jgi:hypothetical protein
VVRIIIISLFATMVIDGVEAMTAVVLLSTPVVTGVPFFDFVLAVTVVAVDDATWRIRENGRRAEREQRYG